MTSWPAASACVTSSRPTLPVRLGWPASRAAPCGASRGQVHLSLLRLSDREERAPGRCQPECQPPCRWLPGALEASGFTDVSSLRDSSVQATRRRGCSELLEIRLLGPFEVVAGGTLADVGGSKRQALLAMLALRQRPGGRRRQRSSTALWGEELPAAPRNALHHHIARLRAALGERSIVGSADGYALKRRAAWTRCRFEELLAETRSALRDGDVRAASDAVAVGAGPLARLGAAGADRHGVVQRRGAPARDAARRRARGGLRGQRSRSVSIASSTPALRSALADNPFRERLWGQLMLALYRSGRQADALETFQEARRVLADELGLEPGPELRRLQEAILAHDPAIAAVPCRPQAPRQPSRRRRRRSSAARTSSARVAGPAARAPPRHAHRASRRRQEQARGRDGALRSSTSSRTASGSSTSRARAARTTPSDSSRTRSTSAAPTRSRA